ncbi:hypothetical protein [Acinetobacter genomosp. 15BJ]|uniref:Uncharacterized protein n=1 Tax=Acinetobacter genomosp. 15BJ TaxID=106651 RepID=R9B916_9GAMM|nr:hypothetical protein [Acinetobacter genomosp. 15BJ]EOR08866.1 hypothetical protein F896_01396 [Acinetobacter genomosp. 15BJ]MCH7293289.1 hypothetical protein [Acinetobacter genomosp. 15BJ]MDO3658875.1 hypothetical protein [Acinetobacter genomosp. 15BJ]
MFSVILNNMTISEQLENIFTEEIVFKDARGHLVGFLKESKAKTIVLNYDDVGEKVTNKSCIDEIDFKIEAIVYQNNCLLGYSDVRIYVALGECHIEKAIGVVSSELGNLILYYSMDSVEEGEIYAYSSDLIYQST